MSAITVNATWSSGSRGNKHPSGGACVGVAGAGLPSAFYATNGNISVRMDDDGSIWINETSLTVQQDAISNANTDGSWGGDSWWFHGLYVSTRGFTLVDGPGGPSGYGSGVLAYNGGKISHDGYGTGNASSHYSWLSGGSSTGWQKIANSVDELEHSADNTVIYLYAGGLIDYNSTPTTSISISAARIALNAPTPGFTQFFDYYPWERRMSNDWKSLNREGGKSTTAGLFRRSSGVWNPCTNTTSSDNSKNHGFRYNNGWQKSPKSGTGA